MEVFISEKDMPECCEDCTIYKLGLGCCLTDFSRTTPKTERHNRCPLKSLDQHDAEIRADERKKIVAELIEFIKEKEHFEGLEGYWGDIVVSLTLLKQKLNELKESKL